AVGTFVVLAAHVYKPPAVKREREDDELSRVIDRNSTRPCVRAVLRCARSVLEAASEAALIGLFRLLNFTYFRPAGNFGDLKEGLTDCSKMSSRGPARFLCRTRQSQG